jgi:hypothetical protein
MGTRFTTNDPDRESKMTIESNRRQVLKGAGGALTAAGVMGQAGGRESADRVDISEKTDVDDRDADLLPNTWMHSVGTTPFRGAHGHRNWSPYPIARRAENLNEVGFNAIGLIADDIAHILEFETGFANKSTTAGLNELNDPSQRTTSTSLNWSSSPSGFSPKMTTAGRQKERPESYYWRPQISSRRIT